MIIDEEKLKSKKYFKYICNFNKPIKNIEVIKPKKNRLFLNLKLLKLIAMKYIKFRKLSNKMK